LRQGGAEIDLITLKDGDYFGEMALMLNEPRHANCIAVSGETTHGCARELHLRLRL